MATQTLEEMVAAALAGGDTSSNTTVQVASGASLKTKSASGIVC